MRQHRCLPLCAGITADFRDKPKAKNRDTVGLTTVQLNIAVLVCLTLGGVGTLRYLILV
jgi:hypothetical protein